MRCCISASDFAPSRLTRQLRESGADQMHVRVIKSRHGELPMQIDHACLGIFQSRDFVVRAGRDDHFAARGQSLHARPARVAGINVAVRENQIGAGIAAPSSARLELVMEVWFTILVDEWTMPLTASTPRIASTDIVRMICSRQSGAGKKHVSAAHEAVRAIRSVVSKMRFKPRSDLWSHTIHRGCASRRRARRRRWRWPEFRAREGRWRRWKNVRDAKHCRETHRRS